jgi:hypothetical protein
MQAKITSFVEYKGQAFQIEESNQEIENTLVKEVSSNQTKN